MGVDWERYEESYLYRLRTSFSFLEKQSESLKKRGTRAAKRSMKRNSTILVCSFALLYFVSAPISVYGLVMVGTGATILAWTAFRVHEKAFREAALVPDDRLGDSEYQERVSMTASNYTDALSGVLLVASGFTVRVATSLV